MIPLLVLRPEPGASDTEARAMALGLSVLKRPLFYRHPLDWRVEDAEQYDAILLTSANAVRGLGPELQSVLSLPVYAVGQATAKAASIAGFTTIMSGDSDAQALVDRMAHDHCKRVLHLCGSDRVPLQVDFDLVAIPVYAMRPNAVELPMTPLVALVHSPRSARRFAALSPNRADTEIVAISATVAMACGLGWAGVYAIDRPNDDAMLALAAPLCKRG